MEHLSDPWEPKHNPEGGRVPADLSVQLHMQALEMKPTDLWAYLVLPSKFIDGWFLVRGAINDYQAAMRDT